MELDDRLGGRSPSIKLRHSSLSTRLDSNDSKHKEPAESRSIRKSNSRLSFADDLETDRSSKNTKNLLKNLHESSLSRERSNESMRRNRIEPDSDLDTQRDHIRNNKSIDKESARDNSPERPKSHERPESRNSSYF